MTLFGIAISIMAFLAFVLGNFLIVFLCFIMRGIPFLNPKTKKYIIHVILQKVCGLEMDILFNVKKRYFGFENLDFDKPSIIIANHTTFGDILTLVRLHPKLVLMVNDWVYNSPLFGSVISFLDFLPAQQGYENNLVKVKQLVADGYSIVVFPEGKSPLMAKLVDFIKVPFS